MYSPKICKVLTPGEQHDAPTQRRAREVRAEDMRSSHLGLRISFSWDTLTQIQLQNIISHVPLFPLASLPTVSSLTLLDLAAVIWDAAAAAISWLVPADLPPVFHSPCCSDSMDIL